MHRPVGGRQAHRLADEIAVVENVVMGERRPLGRAGGAAGELDVDGIVELQRLSERGEFGELRGRGRRGDFGEVEGAGGLLAPQPDHDLQIGKPRRLEAAGRRAVQLGRKRPKRRDIVVAPEASAQNQRLAADLVHRIVELVRAIRRIDVDEDEARLGGGELRQHPFGVVGRPDADALARLEVERDQSGREIVGAAAQFLVSPANRLMTHNQRRAVRRRPGDPVQQSADRLADQRLVADPVNIALDERCHVDSSS